MTIFAVMATSDPVKLAQAIGTVFPLDAMQVASGQWIIAATGTAKDVSDRLGITDGSNGAAIVFTTAGYYGRAGNNVWEWMAAKLRQV